MQVHLCRCRLWCPSCLLSSLIWDIVGWTERGRLPRNKEELSERIVSIVSIELMSSRWVGKGEGRKIIAQPGESGLASSFKFEKLAMCSIFYRFLSKQILQEKTARLMFRVWVIFGNKRNVRWSVAINSKSKIFALERFPGTWCIVTSGRNETFGLCR